MYTCYYFVVTCNHKKFGDIVDHCSILELSLELAISEVRQYYTYDDKNGWKVVSVVQPSGDELDNNDYPLV